MNHAKHLVNRLGAFVFCGKKETTMNSNQNYTTGKPKSKATKNNYARQSRLTEAQRRNLDGLVVPMSLQVEIEKYDAQNRRVIR